MPEMPNWAALFNYIPVATHPHPLTHASYPSPLRIR